MPDVRNPRHDAYQHLYTVLDTATRERDSRWRPVATATGQEPGWVAYERETMLAAVNDLRAQRGLPPVDLAAIEAVDVSAAGHIDWMEKFTLRCARLATGEDDRG